MRCDRCLGRMRVIKNMNVSLKMCESYQGSVTVVEHDEDARLGPLTGEGGGGAISHVDLRDRVGWSARYSC